MANKDYILQILARYIHPTLQTEITDRDTSKIHTSNITDRDYRQRFECHFYLYKGYGNIL